MYRILAINAAGIPYLITHRTVNVDTIVISIFMARTTTPPRILLFQIEARAGRVIAVNTPSGKSCHAAGAIRPAQASTESIRVSREARSALGTRIMRSMPNSP